MPIEEAPTEGVRQKAPVLLRFAGPNNDIPRPDPAKIPDLLARAGPVKVAVIAEGAITPMGNSAEETWQAYINGKSGIVKHTYEPYSTSRGEGMDPQIRAITAGTVKDFNPMDRLVRPGILPRKEIMFKVGTYAQYGLASAFEALSKVKAYAGTEQETSLLIPRFDSPGVLNKDRKWIINSHLVDPLYVTAIIGCGFGGGDVSAEVWELLQNGDIPSGDHMMLSLLDRAASTVTQAFGINGGAEGDVGACASSGKAMLTAMYKIANGDAEVALVVGTEGVLGKPMASAMFDSLGALDRITNPDDPIHEGKPTISRALHRDRWGFTIGEGSVTLAIADPGWARRNDIPILYEIIGYGDTSGAKDNVAPNGEAQEQAMLFARRRAEMHGPIEGYVVNSGHYTATPLGDAGEFLRTANVLHDKQDRTVIVSSKLFAGHLLGAAGNKAQFLSGKILQTGIVPGMRFDGEIMPEAYGWDIPTKTRYGVEATDSLTNQFGFGDANVGLWCRKTN